MAARHDTGGLNEPQTVLVDETALSVVERKRLRDRRAQQRLREKRDSQIRQLEEHVAYCKLNHNDQAQAQASVDQMSQRVQALLKENQILKSRQAQLIALVSSWQEQREQSYDNPAGSTLEFQFNTSTNQFDPCGVPPLSRCTIELPSPCQTRITSELDDTAGDHIDSPKLNAGISLAPSPGEPRPCRIPALPNPSYKMPTSPRTNPDLITLGVQTGVDPLFLDVPFPIATSTLDAPQPPPNWSVVPRNHLDFELTKETAPWFWHPEEVEASPDIPSAVDLLFGSSTNYLANVIHSIFRRQRVAEPERLAMGWLLYLYVKWRMCPSEARFERVPAFLRPLPQQLKNIHEQCCDCIIWPSVRLNMMKRRNIVEEPRPVLALMSCCLRVRWPWGQEIVENRDGGLKVREGFYQTFARLDGWGITPEFIQAYPELMEGMDVDAVTYYVF